MIGKCLRLSAMLAAALVAWPSAARAGVSVDITVVKPTKSGKLELKLADTNKGLKDVDVSVDIDKDVEDDATKKATKVAAAITAKLTALRANNDPEGNGYTAASAADVVTVTKTGGGGMEVTITKDDTGEGDKITTKKSGGNGDNTFWRFVRWVIGAEGSPVVPSGASFTLTLTNGVSVTVTGDGVKTAATLSAEITEELVQQGLVFTATSDPSGALVLTSQALTVGNSPPPGGVGAETSDDWATWFGGFGVALEDREGIVLLNEVDADQTGTDSVEFVELFNDGGLEPLEHYFLVFYNGSAAGNAEYDSFELGGSTVAADGWFVVGAGTVANVDLTPAGFPATNAIQNGADAVALWLDLTDKLSEASFAGTSPDLPPPGAWLADAIVYDTSDADDADLLAAMTPGQPQVDENLHAAGITESLSRRPDGGYPGVTTTWVAQAPTPGATNGASPFIDLRTGLAGTDGVPVLTGSGSLVGGTPASIDLTHAVPSGLFLRLVSFVSVPTPFKGGTLLPIPIALSLVLSTGPDGSLLLPLTWPTGLPPGFPIWIQDVIPDAAAVQGFALSNGLMAVTP